MSLHLSCAIQGFLSSAHFSCHSNLSSPRNFKPIRSREMTSLKCAKGDGESFVPRWGARQPDRTGAQGVAVIGRRGRSQIWWGFTWGIAESILLFFSFWLPLHIIVCSNNESSFLQFFLNPLANTRVFAIRWTYLVQILKRKISIAHFR